MKKLIGHPKLHNLTKILGANVVNNLSSFAIIIFAARLLVPAEFAKLTLALAIASNLASVLDFGAHTSIVRLYSVATDEIQRISLIRALLKWKFGLLLLISLLAFPLGQLLTKCFSILQDSLWLAVLSIVAGGLLTIWMTTRSIEQSQKDFRTFGIYTIVYGFLRLILAAFFLITQQISVINIFIALNIGPLSVLILHKMLFQRASLTLTSKTLNNHQNSRPTWRTELQAFQSLLTYSLWVGTAGILFTILYQIPQYVLAAQSASAEEIGFYGAALTFIPIFMLTNDSIQTVLLPDVSAIQDAKSRQGFRALLWKLAPIYFGVMAVCLLSLSGVQYVLLGEVYRASILIFLVLGIGIIITMYLGYYNTLIHSIGIPHLHTWVNAVRALVVLLLCVLLPKSALFMSAVLGIVMVIAELFIYRMVKQRDAHHVLSKSN